MSPVWRFLRYPRDWVLLSFPLPRGESSGHPVHKTSDSAPRALVPCLPFPPFPTCPLTRETRVPDSRRLMTHTLPLRAGLASQCLRVGPRQPGLPAFIQNRTHPFPSICICSQFCTLPPSQRRDGGRYVNRGPGRGASPASGPLLLPTGPPSCLFRLLSHSPHARSTDLLLLTSSCCWASPPRPQAARVGWAPPSPHLLPAPPPGARMKPLPRTLRTLPLSLLSAPHHTPTRTSSHHRKGTFTSLQEVYGVGTGRESLRVPRRVIKSSDHN